LPQLWFRNTWSWKNDAPKPELTATKDGAVAARHPELGSYELYCEGSPELLFCDNETNVRRLYGQNEASGHFKDAFNEYVINGHKQAVNSQQTGTKAAAHYQFTVPAGGSACVRLRLTQAGQASRLSSERASAGERSISPVSLRSARAGGTPALAFSDFDKLITQRRREADEFYARLRKDITDADARNVRRRAFAGMIWSKQFFYYDVPEWIKGDANQPPPPNERKHGQAFAGLAADQRGPVRPEQPHHAQPRRQHRRGLHGEQHARLRPTDGALDRDAQEHRLRMPHTAQRKVLRFEAKQADNNTEGGRSVRSNAEPVTAT